jgi:spermidine/putrescine transport system permease protein
VSVERKLPRGVLPVLPAAIWMAILLAAPLAGVLLTSLLTRGADGEVRLPLTIENYRRLAGFGILGYDPVHLRIALRTVTSSLLSTALCVLLGTPVAFFIGTRSPRLRAVLLVLVCIPFWTNLLVRTYAWQILLAPRGVFASLAGMVLAGASESGLYPSYRAVLVGLVCDYLPYFVLPLYASVEQVDWRLYEAAADMGAPPARAFLHGVLPQVLPGLIAGTTMVFVPSLGQFVVSDLLGGSKELLLGNAIAQQFGQSRDWPFGAALATVQLVLAIALLRLARRAKGSDA